MVRENRIKTVNTGVLTAGTNGNVETVTERVNGQLWAVEVLMKPEGSFTSTSADVTLYDFNHSGNSAFDYLTVAASGARRYYPRNLPVNMSGVALANTETTFSLNNQVGVGVVTAGNGSSLEVRLSYI